MPPGTVHAVLTVADCLAEGGHFYSALSMTQSMRAGLREMQSGSGDTNTQHIAAEQILQKVVQCYDMDITASGAPPGAFRSGRESKPLTGNVEPGTEEHDEILTGWPPLPELAALLVMVGHARHFEPEMLGEGGRYECAQDLMDGRDDAAPRIHRILQFWPDLNPHVRAAESAVTDASGVAIKSLVVNRKRKGDAAAGKQRKRRRRIVSRAVIDSEDDSGQSSVESEEAGASEEADQMEVEKEVEATAAEPPRRRRGIPLITSSESENSPEPSPSARDTGSEEPGRPQRGSSVDWEEPEPNSQLRGKRPRSHSHADSPLPFKRQRAIG